MLRAIANLYPRASTWCAQGRRIKTIKDLRGKRISLDEPGPGTLVDARLILSAYGLTEKEVKAEYLKSQQAADKLKDNALDAFFSVSGWPLGAIAELAATTGIDLVPIDGRRPRTWSRRTASLPSTRFPTAPTRASAA